MRSGPWFTIWQCTHGEPGQAALICLTSVKKKNLNWLYKLYGFFSTGRFKCHCVLRLAWAFPGEQSPLKGFWGRIKVFSSRGGRNTIIMLSSLRTPTNEALSIHPQHWGGKPAVSADSCRTVAINLAFWGAPSLSPKHSSFCQVTTFIALCFAIWFPVIINEGQEGLKCRCFKTNDGQPCEQLKHQQNPTNTAMFTY